MPKASRPPRANFSNSNSKRRVAEEAHFSQQRTRVIFHVYPNFSPPKLKFKNAVILLKLLISFKPLLDHVQAGLLYGLVQEPPWPEYLGVTAYPPLPPGACGELRSPFLHVQVGRFGPARAQRARSQGVVCSGLWRSFFRSLFPFVTSAFAVAFAFALDFVSLSLSLWLPAVLTPQPDPAGGNGACEWLYACGIIIISLSRLHRSQVCSSCQLCKCLWGGHDI